MILGRLFCVVALLWAVSVSARTCVVGVHLSLMAFDDETRLLLKFLEHGAIGGLNLVVREERSKARNEPIPDAIQENEEKMVSLCRHIAANGCTTVDDVVIVAGHCPFPQRMLDVLSRVVKRGDCPQLSDALVPPSSSSSSVESKSPTPESASSASAAASSSVISLPSLPTTYTFRPKILAVSCNFKAQRYNTNPPVLNVASLTTASSQSFARPNVVNPLWVRETNGLTCDTRMNGPGFITYWGTDETNGAYPDNIACSYDDGFSGVEPDSDVDVQSKSETFIGAILDKDGTNQCKVDKSRVYFFSVADVQAGNVFPHTCSFPVPVPPAPLPAAVAHDNVLQPA